LGACGGWRRLRGVLRALGVPDVACLPACLPHWVGCMARQAAAAARHIPRHARKIVEESFSEAEVQGLVEAGAGRLAGGVGGVQDLPYKEWNVTAARGARLVRSAFVVPPLRGALARALASLLGIPPSKF